MYRIVGFPDYEVALSGMKDYDFYPTIVFGTIVSSSSKTKCKKLIVASDDYSEPFVIETDKNSFNTEWLTRLYTFFRWNRGMFFGTSVVIATKDRLDFNTGGAAFYNKETKREIPIIDSDKRAKVYRYGLSNLCICIDDNEDNSIILRVENDSLYIGGVKRKPVFFNCAYVEILCIKYDITFNHYVIYLNNGDKLVYCYDAGKTVTILYNGSRYNTISKAKWLASKIFKEG